MNAPTVRSATRALALVLCGFVIVSLAASSVRAAGEATPSGDRKRQAFTGPSSAEGQLEDDSRDKNAAVRYERLDAALDDYFNAKKRFKDKTGFSIGTEYDIMLQGGGPPVGSEKFAASGRWATYGSWTLVDRNGSSPGDLVFKGENRHSLGTTLAPETLNQSLGPDLTTAEGFNDDTWLLTNLFWHQQFDDGRFAFVIGQIDPTDYIDTYPLVNPWTDFGNGAFTNTPNIAMPDQTLGMAVGALPGDHVYAIAGVADPNGNPAKPFDTFFAGGEVFVSGEVGWVASLAKRQEDNFHVTGWYVSSRPQAGVGSGWGLTFNASWQFEDRWTPFARGGFSVGETTAVKGNVAAGVGIMMRGDDQLAIGLAWTRPAQGVGPDQYTAEVFYRLQVLRNFALTPDLQVVLNPVGRSTGTAVVIAGLRSRLVF
jgi:porin